MIATPWSFEYAIAPEALYERPWIGPMLFSMDCFTLLLLSISFHKKAWSELYTHCLLSVDQVLVKANTCFLRALIRFGVVKKKKKKKKKKKRKKDPYLS